MIRPIIISLIIIFAGSQQSNANIAMITECSQPSGMVLNLKPSFQSWHDTNLAETKLVFIRLNVREYNVIIKDRHGDIFVKSHDPHVTKVFEDEDNLTIISTPPIGVVETFQLSTLTGGKRIALWNILRNNSQPMKNTNVNTYLFQCEDK